LRFEVGCDPESEEFKEYWSRNGYSQEDKGYGHDRLLEELVSIVKDNFLQLIVWRQNAKIVGHAVWHESNVEEHRKGGYPRDNEDREALRKLLGRKKDFVELHEWWLIENYGGKGYGNKFLDFFEAYMKSQGHVDLVFYADHPAALAIFRKRGYKEGGYLVGSKEYVFHHSLEAKSTE
jgi:ribosomal protein S18 acetylase RimI-like enzyme